MKRVKICPVCGRKYPEEYMYCAHCVDDNGHGIFLVNSSEITQSNPNYSSSNVAQTSVEPFQELKIQQKTKTGQKVVVISHSPVNEDDEPLIVTNPVNGFSYRYESNSGYNQNPCKSTTISKSEKKFERIPTQSPPLKGEKTPKTSKSPIRSSPYTEPHKRGKGRAKKVALTIKSIVCGILLGGLCGGIGILLGLLVAVIVCLIINLVLFIQGITLDVETANAWGELALNLGKWIGGSIGVVLGAITGAILGYGK